MNSTIVSKEQVSALSRKSEDIFLRHLNAFSNNDLEALMSDYTEQSILITQDQTYRGSRQIRGFLSDLLTHFPKDHSEFKLDKLVANDELVFVVWRATTPVVEVSFATDTFIIKEGKIFQQTFAGQMEFLN